MSHTLVTLPFYPSPRGHEVKNLQKMHMNFIHQPILIVCAYDRSIPQYDRIPKILRVVNQSVITKAVFVPCFRSSDF